MAALPQRLLRQVSRPARYTGGEWNSVHKPWDGVGLRVCLAYPDTYEAGALHPAFDSLYQRLNGDPALLAERVFAPWPDLALALRSEGLPLPSLESGRPLGDFDVLAFCLPHLLAGTAVLEMLDLARLPLEAAARGARHPLIVGWEEAPTNPEPLALFLDAVLLGDAEVAFLGLLRAWLDLGASTGHPPERGAFLRRLAAEPGIYVPSLYAIHYGSEGRVEEVRPRGDAPGEVTRAVWADLLPAPTQPVVPYLEAMPDRPTVEVQRGCDDGCPRALLGLTTAPLRQRSPTVAAEALRTMLQTTGFEEVRLGAACLRDYGERETLFRTAAQACDALRARLRLPPLGLELLTGGVLGALQGPRPSLTLGPEVANEDMLAALDPSGALAGPLAALEEAGGLLGTIRVEVVLGHPTARRGSAGPAAALVRALRRATGPRTQLRVSASLFVPRPFTPWQWAGQPPLAALRDELARMRTLFGRRAGTLATADPEVAQVQAALARGDRRMGAVLHHAWSAGSVLDARPELCRPSLWQEAFRAAGLDLAELAQCGLDIDAPLPWDHLTDTPSRARLRELLRSQAAS